MRIVKCINDTNQTNPCTIGDISPVKAGEYYEIVRISFSDGLILEGAYSGTIKPGYLLSGREVGWNKKRFREVQLPPSLELEISESLNRQLQEA